MTMLLSVFLIALLGLTSAVEYPCTHRSTSGDFYDLSPLSKCDATGYSVQTPQDGTFSLNVCNNVQGCGSASSNCQTSGGGTFDCGHASSATFSDYTGSGKGVVLTYSSGQTCPNNQPRKTVVTFTCSTDEKPTFTFVSEQPQCTYNFVASSKEACPKASAPQQQTCQINVFIVPHTHDDVGWLQTVQGYYTSQVKHILDTAVAALQANPQRTFIYVEQAFFTLWWADPNTSDQQRQAVKTFVKEGRWEFVIGAWVMPDEACTTYGAVIDQMTLGHQFLLNTFGVMPTKGWQIDPFGESATTAVLEKLAGFDAHLVDRITHKNVYENTQRLEFLWQGSPSLGQNGQIFTEMMGGGTNGYCDWYFAFNFDDDPVNPSNVASYGNKFVQMVQSRINWYKTPNMLAQWGCDFAFQHADKMFHSMDQVVAWLQANANSTQLNVKYATLSEYYDSVFKSKDVQYPLMTGGDFFPLYDGLWWTGYFTSRVELKGYVRQGEAASHTAESLYALGRVSLSFDSKKAFDQLYGLRVANGYAQHHDGVTGTSVPEVVAMYKQDLIQGINGAFGSTANILSLFIQKKGSPQPQLAPSTNAITNIMPGQTIALVLFNSLGWTRQDIVVIPVNRSDLVVTDSAGNKVVSQVSPTLGPGVTSRYELFFNAKVGPLGFATYFVSSPSTEYTPNTQSSPVEVVDADTVFENSVFNVTISGSTGLISNIVNKKTGVSLSVQQNLMSYVSSHSGAYAFAPSGPKRPISTSPPRSVVNTGPIVSEMHQTFSNFAKQTIRLFNGGGDLNVEGYVQILFDLGPLPSHTEVVSTFTTPINTQGKITTDSNGYETQSRKYDTTVPLEANYYPLVYSAFINDASSQLSVISERSHGVASLTNGELEVMVHRNPDMGDGFGPGLTDTSQVYPSLRVLVDSPAESRELVHHQPYFQNFPLTPFTSVAQSASNWASTYVTQNNLLSADLPSNLHLLSLSTLDATSTGVILRLTHLYAVGEDPTYSRSVTIDITKIFSGVNVASVKETTVSANKVLGNVMAPIVINPKEIRTFVVEFSPK